MTTENRGLGDQLPQPQKLGGCDWRSLSGKTYRLVRWYFPGLGPRWTASEGGRFLASASRECPDKCRVISRPCGFAAQDPRDAIAYDDPQAIKDAIMALEALDVQDPAADAPAATQGPPAPSPAPDSAPEPDVDPDDLPISHPLGRRIVRVPITLEGFRLRPLPPEPPRGPVIFTCRGIAFRIEPLERPSDAGGGIVWAVFFGGLYLCNRTAYGRWFVGGSDMNPPTTPALFASVVEAQRAAESYSLESLRRDQANRLRALAEALEKGEFTAAFGKDDRGNLSVTFRAQEAASAG